MLYLNKIISVMMSAEYGTSVDEKGIGPWWALIFGLSLAVLIIVFFMYRIIVERLTCTVPVEAVCVEYTTLYSDNGTTYAPVWEYEYEGQFIRSPEKVYSNTLKVKQGEIRILYINPNSPKKFRQNIKGYVVYVFVGIFIAALIIWAMTVKAGN